MNLKLKASLQEALNKWVEDVADSDEWAASGIYFGEDTEEHMTNAVATVFDAIAEAQKFERRQEVSV